MNLASIEYQVQVYIEYPSSPNPFSHKGRRGAGDFALRDRDEKYSPINQRQSI
jgi:hypothetical protein